MANYVTLKEADASARALMAAGTVTEAHSCLTTEGKPAVRILRKVATAGYNSTEGGQSKAGGWATILAEADA